LIGGDFAADEVYLNANVGIGTNTPGAELEVNGQVIVDGQIQITGGNPGANKVLMSDASGLASWSAQGGGGGMGASMATAYMNANNMFSPHTNDCGADAFVPLFTGATVGFCMEKNERSAHTWHYAVSLCLADGKRLPEIWEFLHACPDRVALGINNLLNTNVEWASNFAVPQSYALHTGVGPGIYFLEIVVSGFGSAESPQNCYQSCPVIAANSDGNSFTKPFRCVR
jgi:hypothetical protein